MMEGQQGYKSLSWALQAAGLRSA